jgi:hypothetical protein
MLPMSRKGKLPSRQENPTLVMRFVQRSDGGLAIIATETPIERFDERLGLHREVLLMEGCVFRGNRDQIPIVDSHDDTTVRNIFGSIRDMRIDLSTGKLFGKPMFASDEEAQVVAKRYEEGHITDFSITADPLEGFVVQRGQSYTLSSGEVIEGPAKIITKWMPLNASICATGADVNSSAVMRSYTQLDRKIERQMMDEILLAKLVEMGLPEGMSDANQIMAWVVGNMAAKSVDTPATEAVSEVVESMASESKPDEAKPIENSSDAAASEEEKMDMKEEVQRALKADVERQKEIRAIVGQVGLDNELADELCFNQTPLDDARKIIIERMAAKSKAVGTATTSATVVRGEEENITNAMRDGLIKRSLSGSKLKIVFDNDKPAAGHDVFERMSIKRMAEAYVQQVMRIDTSRMNEPDIAKVAMGSRSAMDRLRIQRAYHTTGSFANLLLDAANKTLLQAYEEAPFSWNLWARQAASVADFKNINRIRFSESPDPEQVPELADYPEKAMSDSKESYKVDKYGAIFTVSWETVVNDDMDAISRIPAMHGNACRRKVNKAVYAVLTANATMGDGVALFGSHSSGTNLAGSAAAPSVTTLNAAWKAMATQKGLSSDVIINVVPRFLIVPVAVAATALELVKSTSYIVPNGNSGVQNLYGVGGTRSLNVVEEPQLDSNSETAWYLAADAAQIDTVEVSFLQGEESPVLESEWNFDNDSYKYKVRQTFGVKAIDWRGLYKNAGA